ncbi:MAG: ferritin, partial [Bacteroidetes bacterium]
MTPGSEKNESGIQGSELTEAEIDGIRFMREEEKVARDVYIYLYEIHPLRPFLNISKSEQAHMDAIKYLIDAFDIEDPVGENPEGVFQNEELQELYDALIEKGSTSREEALRVAALIEEVDIIDLRTELDSIASNED